MENETRVYPPCCTSAFCGRTECEGCPSKPILVEFKAWKERTAAVRPNCVWSPTIWQATR